MEPALSPEQQEPAMSDLLGQVFDRRTGRALAGAAIVVRSGPAPAPDLCPLSAEDGRFELADLAPGRWCIGVALAGYRPATCEVTLAAAGAECVRIGLVPV
jgi:hypothetical protein